jgi:glycerophosphoryl diester phosphodiesterase
VAVTLPAFAVPAAAADTQQAADTRRAEAQPAALEPRPCDQVPEPDRWVDAGTPDSGLADPLISAHRGFPVAAPENTLWSYRYAFGAGADLVEVDVRETTDGRFVAFHDSTVDAQTDGTGRVEQMTYSQARALNVADNDRWRGSIYDSSRMASLDEVLALAKSVGGGVELDIKTTMDVRRIVKLVERHDLIDDTIFNWGSDVLVRNPDVRIIYNRDRDETPAQMYEIAKVAAVFGSRLDEYTPESIVAVHDACGIVMPHAYDAGSAVEGQQALAARAIGADGVQTNQPDVVLDAFDMPVATKLRRDGDQVCLANAGNQMGMPGKPLTLANEDSSTTVTTALGGCVALPGEQWQESTTVTFAGDGAAVDSTLEL